MQQLRVSVVYWSLFPGQCAPKYSHMANYGRLWFMSVFGTSTVYNGISIVNKADYGVPLLKADNACLVTVAKDEACSHHRNPKDKAYAHHRSPKTRNELISAAQRQRLFLSSLPKNKACCHHHSRKTRPVLVTVAKDNACSYHRSPRTRPPIITAALRQRLFPSSLLKDKACSHHRRRKTRPELIYRAFSCTEIIFFVT